TRKSKSPITAAVAAAAAMAVAAVAAPNILFSLCEHVSSDSTNITFLGTGTSVGVPVIGCHCPVCTSTDPCNNRTRSSILVTSPQATILIDSGPDLREQALREKLSAIDAVLYTHSHLDHVA